MPVWSSICSIYQVQPLLASKWARSTLFFLLYLLACPWQGLAQGSPFDTGFNAIQSLFTGTIAKVASLVAIVIGGFGFHTVNQAQKRRLPELPREPVLRLLATNVLSWLWAYRGLRRLRSMLLTSKV